MSSTSGPRHKQTGDPAYIGLSHDALDFFIPSVLRKKHQLELTLPNSR